jgi:hypothetical protein
LFDYITEADFLIADKSRKSHAIRLASSPVLLHLTALWLFTFHGILLLKLFFNTWYAPQASSKGGTTVVRCATEAWVTANFTSAEVALGNSDHSKAIAPVTKGVAALVPLNFIV